jgi:CHAT domain-containing protein
VLTPPASPSSDDDGLLTASEIAQLRLDADWVILSACNTAAEGATEGASSMARAFFYAGARSLLLSHWEVDSAAAAALVTELFGRLAGNRGLSRAEALRQAMLRVASTVDGYTAHPVYWAPFVIVGADARE